jgi:hypothetical protein
MDCWAATVSVVHQALLAQGLATPTVAPPPPIPLISVGGNKTIGSVYISSGATGGLNVVNSMPFSGRHRRQTSTASRSRPVMVPAPWSAKRS